MKINVEQIYDEHAEALYRFFYFKVLNKPLAEDLTSQTFTKFVEEVNKRTKTIQNPDNFLYGIGRNVFNNHLREKYKARYVSLDEIENAVAAVESDTPPEDASLEERALPHIEQLPDAQRRVAHMRLIQKQTNSEIAASLNRSTNYVKATLRRALRSLEQNAGTFRSKIPFILLLLPARGGQSYLRLLTETAAAPDPTFMANLKTGLAASAAGAGAAATEATGLIAKVQNFFKNPAASGGTAVATVAVVAAAFALGGDDPTLPPQADPPQVPVSSAPAPPPDPPSQPDPVVATVTSPPPQVLAAQTPAPPTPPPPPVLPEPQLQPDATWKAEFWILDHFNQHELPTIPNIPPDYVRFDESIDFDWGFKSPLPDADFPRSQFAIRWTKTALFEEPGTYTFTTKSDDGVRVYADKEIVIDNWTNHRTVEDTAQVELEAGLHDLTVEYYDNNYEAEISFDYELAGDSANQDDTDDKKVTGEPEPTQSSTADDDEESKVLKPLKPLQKRTSSEPG